MNDLDTEEFSETPTGGRVHNKKNITAKNPKKKGNKVLAAWRDHVKAVAKTEGMNYGKEAMQMAKKGKHGKEWEQIKASLNSQKGGVDTPPSVPKDEIVDGADDQEPDVQEPENLKAKTIADEAKEIDDEDNKKKEDKSEIIPTMANEMIPTVQAEENPDFVGGRRRTKKRKGRKSRKSRKQRRSRKH